MQQIQLIGNVGADASIIEVNGEKFVSFRVAVTEKRGSGEDAEKYTTWYSCTYNRPDSPVVNYLKTGQQVFIEGRPRYYMYDSAKYHCKMIDVQVYVNALHLCGRPADRTEEQEVPTY